MEMKNIPFAITDWTTVEAVIAKGIFFISNNVISLILLFIHLS